jgi:putative peptidoglycan lipid II flippase
MKDGHQITRSAGLVGLFTLGSRVLGLVRDAVLAASFRKQATDAFFVANTIPNVLRRLLGEGTLTVAFIPVFTAHLSQQGHEAARRMLAAALGVLLVVMTLVTAAGVLFAPWVVRLFAYGFVDDPQKMNLAVLLTRVMIGFFVTAGLTALAMGVLNTCRHFAAPALAPVMLNAVIITSIAAGVPVMLRLGLPPITAAGLGVLLGGVAQALFQLPFLRRHGMLVAPRVDLRHPGVRRVAWLMLPAVFGLAVYEVNVIVARQLASFLPAGAVSFLYYAQRLIEFPMGIFAVAIATVAMPNLSTHASTGDFERLKETYRYALRMVFFIMLPATAGLAALALPLTSVLFQRGEFTHAMANTTAVTLLGFLAGLWAGAGVRQTVPVYYAMQDTWTPVKVAALSLVVYLGAALPLHRSLQTLGLALAVSASSAVNFVTLVIILRVRLGQLGLRSIAASVARSGAAAVPCGILAWRVGLVGDWERGGMALQNVGILTGAVLAGAVVYAVLAWLLKAPELEELVRAFRRRSARGRGDASGSEENSHGTDQSE